MMLCIWQDWKGIVYDKQLIQISTVSILQDHNKPLKKKVTWTSKQETSSSTTTLPSYMHPYLSVKRLSKNLDGEILPQSFASESFSKGNLVALKELSSQFETTEC